MMIIQILSIWLQHIMPKAVLLIGESFITPNGIAQNIGAILITVSIARS